MKGTGEGASGTHPGRIASRDFRERVPRTPRAAPAGKLRACPLGTPSPLPLPTEPPQPPLRSPGRAPAALRAPGAPSTVSARSPGAAGRPPPGAGPGWAPGPPRSARPSLALHRPTRASRSPCPLRSLSAPPAPCARTPALLRAAAAGFHSEETETGRTGRGCNGPRTQSACAPGLSCRTVVLEQETMFLHPLPHPSVPPSTPARSSPGSLQPALLSSSATYSSPHYSSIHLFAYSSIFARNFCVCVHSSIHPSLILSFHLSTQPSIHPVIPCIFLSSRSPICLPFSYSPTHLWVHPSSDAVISRLMGALCWGPAGSQHPWRSPLQVAGMRLAAGAAPIGALRADSEP